MPPFKTINRIDAIKPGASVLAEVEIEGGGVRPALVVQPFGRGRAAALFIADLWRWSLKREDQQENDLDKAWRQTVRWLVADVPAAGRSRNPPAAGTATRRQREILIRARDKQFEPLDNAEVKLQVKTPDKREIEVGGREQRKAPGTYRATFAPRVCGRLPRHCRPSPPPTAAPSATRETGWTVEPETEEFRTLTANRPLLERIASQTGGEVLTLERPGIVRCRPAQSQNSGDRKLDVSAVASVARVSDRIRLPDRRMGPAAVEGPAMRTFAAACLMFSLIAIFSAA